MMTKTVLALAAAQVATAHFGLTYPDWRADTLDAPEDSEYDQWTYPCANVPFGEGNITDWPLDGGAVQIELGHYWTYVFIHAGLGNDTTDFNITLTPDLWNTTGEGSLCIDKLDIPEGSGVTEGAIGSLRVITVDDSGSSLYNCADIRFTADAPDAPACNNTIEIVAIRGNASDSTHGDHGSGGEDADSAEGETGGDGGGGAGLVGVNMGTLATLAGLSAVIVLGL